MRSALDRAERGATQLDDLAARTNSEPATDAQYRCLADVKMVPIRWLWPGRIARGKFTLIAGDPGLGKSQLAASLSAVVTTGGTWPVDRTKCEPGSVILLNAEDDAADTILPRLRAAGANVRRVFVLDSIREAGKDGRAVDRSFNLAADLESLASVAERIGGATLIVIDPLSAYLGGTDTHNNADMRSLLAPLGELAARLGAAIVAISHLNKGSNGGSALTRVTGSLAFVAAARAAFLIAKDAKNPARRLCLPLKNNLGPDAGDTGLAFSVEGVSLDGGIETSRLIWESEPVSITANEALSANDDADGERGERDEAADWLRELLEFEAMTAKQVKVQSGEAGIAWRTVQRAKDAAGVESKREGFGPDAKYVWRMKTPMRAMRATDSCQEKQGTHGAHGDGISPEDFVGDVP